MKKIHKTLLLILLSTIVIGETAFLLSDHTDPLIENSNSNELNTIQQISQDGFLIAQTGDETDQEASSNEAEPEDNEESQNNSLEQGEEEVEEASVPSYGEEAQETQHTSNPVPNPDSPPRQPQERAEPESPIKKFSAMEERIFPDTILQPAIQQIIELNVQPTKESYLRYELVDLVVQNPYHMDYHQLAAKFYYQGEPIAGAGGDNIIPFQLKQGKVIARWACGWNPPLGKYTAVVYSLNPRYYVKTDEIAFEIKDRTIPEMDKGLAIANLEENYIGGRYRRAYQPIGYESDGTEELIRDWIQFMDFDGFWQMIGQTHGWGDAVNPNRAFDPGIIRNMDRFGPVMEEAGLSYGGYIMCYHAPFSRGSTPAITKVGYLPTLSLEISSGKMYHSEKYISLASPKRLQDIIEMARQIQNHPNIDYVGLDFIRTADFDSFGLCDDIVRDMNLNVPENYFEWSFMERARWFGEQIKYYPEESIIDKWRWWRAHRVAEIVNTIITEAQISKPLWVFTLGWEHGRHHGQDPLMMMDAGASFDSVMLYESNYHQFNALIKVWSEYLKDSPVNLMAGNCVDFRFNDSPRENAILEHYRRNMVGIHDIIEEGTAIGLFWHDLMRALVSNRGGGHEAKYSTYEWAMAAASSVSDFRRELGLIPAMMEISVITTEEERQAKVIIKNQSSQTLTGELICACNPQEIACNPSQKSIEVMAGEEKTYFFNLNILRNHTRIKNGMMVGFKWQIENKRDLFDFIYHPF